MDPNFEIHAESVFLPFAGIGVIRGSVFSDERDGAFAPEAWVGSASQPYPKFAGIRFIRGRLFFTAETAVLPSFFLCIPAPLRENL